MPRWESAAVGKPTHFGRRIARSVVVECTADVVEGRAGKTLAVDEVTNSVEILP
jgi:hypothetical protein